MEHKTINIMCGSPVHINQMEDLDHNYVVISGLDFAFVAEQNDDRGMVVADGDEQVRAVGKALIGKFPKRNQPYIFRASRGLWVGVIERCGNELWMQYYNTDALLFLQGPK